jgi:Uma2 family endonuclease
MMTTTTPVLAFTSYDQVVRLKVSRAAYNALVESLGDDGHVRLTYDGEFLEILSPGALHEIVTRVFAGLLEFVSLEWDLDIIDLGSTTFGPPGGKDFQPDGAWYLDIEKRVRDRTNVDLSVDPPPDLLLETDMTRDSSDKLATFAEMRVPEVWLYNLDGFAAKALDDGQYVAIETSRVIAGLPIAEITNRLADEAGRSNMLTFRRAWQGWLREHKHLHTDAQEE